MILAYILEIQITIEFIVHDRRSSRTVFRKLINKTNNSKLTRMSAGLIELPSLAQGGQ